MDYQSFRSEYENSGLSQKDFSIRKGMSASMVCYYLRRAREQDEDTSNYDVGIFQEIEVQTTNNNFIKITLPSGILIELPIQ